MSTPSGKEIKIKLQAGEQLARFPNNPIISIIPNGRLTFMWIGNDAENDKMCFATVGGKARLAKLALAIQKAFKERG